MKFEYAPQSLDESHDRFDAYNRRGASGNVRYPPKGNAIDDAVAADEACNRSPMARRNVADSTPQEADGWIVRRRPANP